MKYEQKFFEEKAIELQKCAGHMADISTINYGIHIRIKGTSVLLTLWYTKGKYQLNTAPGSMINFTEGKELKLIEKYFNREPEKALGKLPAAWVNPHSLETVKARNTEPVDNAGTAACIKHIERKLELMGEGGNGAVKTMLKTLVSEFQQYS